MGNKIVGVQNLSMSCGETGCVWLRPWDDEAVRCAASCLSFSREKVWIGRSLALNTSELRRRRKDEASVWGHTKPACGFSSCYSTWNRLRSVCSLGTRFMFGPKLGCLSTQFFALSPVIFFNLSDNTPIFNALMKVFATSHLFWKTHFS